MRVGPIATFHKSSIPEEATALKELSATVAKPKAAPRREILTEAKLDALLRTRPHRQHVIWDDDKDGKCLCVLVSRGPKHKRQATVTFRVVYYLKTRPGKPRYLKIGRYPDEISLGAARDKALAIRADVKNGIDPRRERLSGDFKNLVDRFVKEYAKENNQTWKETERIFARYVLPEWHARQIEEIKKSDVALLLNRIADGKIKHAGRSIGTRFVARAVRAQLGVFFNWYVENYSSDEFRSPIVKTSTWKTPPARARTLENDELRALWRAVGTLGIYGSVIKIALLTAQRFHKVSTMRRADLKDRLRRNGQEFEHVWDPGHDDDPNNKKVSAVPLSLVARQVVSAIPIIDASDAAMDWVFSVNGRRPLKGWSKYKARLDRLMLNILREDASAHGGDPDLVELRPWQHRDLRRTARTLMSRAGVSDFISERCLAHVIPGVKGVYDRHDYLHEKRDAFEKLATLVESIASLPNINVVPIRAQPRRSRSKIPSANTLKRETCQESLTREEPPDRAKSAF